MKLKTKACSDTKHLAWVSWTLLVNNPVNKTFYLVLGVIDFLIILLYSANLVQRVHFGNFQIPESQTFQNNTNFTVMQTFEKELSWLQSGNQTSNEEFNNPGIRLSFVRQYDFLLYALVKENSDQLLYITIGILGICLFSILTLFLMSLINRNHSDLDKQSVLKRVFCLLLVLIQSVLHIPMFDMIVRAAVATYENQTSMSLEIVIIRYAICALTIGIMGLLMVFLVRIFNISVPTELVPWCAPISKLAFLNLLIRALLVIFSAFDQDGRLALVELIILFLLQTFQASYRVLFAPNYLKEVDILVKTKDFALTLLFFIGIICKILEDNSNYDLVYFIMFLPVVTYGWMLFEDYRRQMILQKVKTRSIKLEIEYEYALYVMMTLVRDSMQETIESQKIFGQLMDLMIVHIEDCDDSLCICDEMENFYELLRLKQLHNQEVFPLLRHERKKYKKIVDDQGLVGTVSNITDHTLKLKTTESTIMRTDQNNNAQNGRLAEREEEEEENNERQGNHLQKKSPNKAKKGKQAQPVKQQQDKKPKRSVFKINIDETKHRFLSELLYLFYFDIIRKYPDSYKIQLLSNFFSLNYKKKEMLCIFQMRSFVKSKLSKLDQYCHCINEQYLLWEISKVQKINMHQSENQQDGNFNGEYFITMNKLYRVFNDCIDQLSQNVVSFWKTIERPQFDVENTQKQGSTIARNIKDTFKVFKELDTLKIFKDYQMYFQFSIIQLHILNDPVAYELYIGKMRSILEINKVYQKNFSSNDSKTTDLSNFIIVDANGSKFGQIIQVNNSLRQLLGWSEDDYMRNRIESFMPMLIRQKHPEFMTRYNKTGQSYIINNKTTVFIKKANGYVIPVELYIKFHYSVDYQYTFLAMIKPFFEMTPFNNGVKYNIDQLLFFIVDNDEGDGRISEYSESCAKLLVNYGFSVDSLEKNGISKQITNIIMDFDWPAIRKCRQQRYLSGTIYEDVHRLDLNQFSENQSLMAQYEMQKVGFGASSEGGGGSNNTYGLGLQQGFVNARTRIFEERYSGGVLDMNIFCLAFIYDNEYLTSGSYYGSSIQSKFKPNLTNGGGMISDKQSKKSFLAVKQQDTVRKDENQHLVNEDLDEHQLDIINERDNESQSASGSYSSARSSTSSMTEFRNFHSFTEQATPKTLTLVIKMIIALYLIMVTIASVNLGINITRQLQSEADVQTVRQAFDRLNSVSMNQLLFRVLLNIGNGYEDENSLILKDRFNKYKELQEKKIQELKDTQSLLQQSKFVTTPEFYQFRTAKIVPLYYLDDKNVPYIQKESLNVAFNLYIAKLNEVNSYSKQQFKGNLQIQNLNPKPRGGYKPTFAEQNFYFLAQNGNQGFRQFSINASEFYSRESEMHAEQNIISTKVTAIISIIIIVAIGLVIAPIITKAEIRKYNALLYFLKIPKEQLPILIKNCEYCLNMNEEKRYLQIMKDYESFLGIKLINQQVDQLRQAKSIQSNLDAQSTRQDGFSSAGLQSSDFYSSQHSNQQSLVPSKNSKNDVSSKPQANANQQQNDLIGDMNGSAMGSVISMGSKSGAAAKRGRNAFDQDAEAMAGAEVEQQQQKDEDAQIDQKEEDVNNNKFNLSNLNLKQNRHKESKSHNQHGIGGDGSVSLKEISVNKGDETDDEENQSAQQEQSEMNQKIHMINSQAYKRRSTMIFSSLSVILMLSTYFLIAYFLAIRTFDTAAQVIGSLEIIFSKGYCFDSTMNFLRASQVRNQSLMIIDEITGKEVSGTDYYLDLCLAKEGSYNKMRVELPSYFQSISQYLDDIESSRFCDTVYQGDFASYNTLCKTSLDGILNKGLTNAFFHMFNQIMKANLLYNSLGPTSRRNATILERELRDETIIQIMDMKAILLDHALNQLKSKSMESVISYIQSLLNDFITAFIIFVAFLTFALVLVILLGFRVLRKSMWDTNIILKIIPFEMLPKTDRLDIKDFFNS